MEDNYKMALSDSEEGYRLDLFDSEWGAVAG
jgi:hypothetical protein